MTGDCRLVFENTASCDDSVDVERAQQAAQIAVRRVEVQPPRARVEVPPSRATGSLAASCRRRWPDARACEERLVDRRLGEDGDGPQREARSDCKWPGPNRTEAGAGRPKRPRAGASPTRGNPGHFARMRLTRVAARQPCTRDDVGGRLHQAVAPPRLAPRCAQARASGSRHVSSPTRAAAARKSSGSGARGRAERLAQVVERHAAAAVRQRQVRGAAHAAPVVAARVGWPSAPRPRADDSAACSWPASAVGRARPATPGRRWRRRAAGRRAPAALVARIGATRCGGSSDSASSAASRTAPSRRGRARRR